MKVMALARSSTVLGISADPPKAQERFRDKHGLAIPLISDETHAMLEAYGAWGELSDADQGQYYNWNGGWGYLKLPPHFNFDRNDMLDIGLYYAHGRWYNQDTGLWLFDTK